LQQLPTLLLQHSARIDVRCKSVFRAATHIEQLRDTHAVLNQTAAAAAAEQQQQSSSSSLYQ
jgi:hypothetical protein